MGKAIGTKWHKPRKCFTNKNKIQDKCDGIPLEHKVDYISLYCKLQKVDVDCF